MISILFPTVRPELYMRAWNSIAPACGDVAYEVIVVADFGPVDLPKTTWVVRERRGIADAMHLAYLESSGDYLFAFNDESILEPWALASLYYYALANPGRVLGPRSVPDYTFVYYGLEFVPFPFVHRDVAKQLGGFFDTAYQCFYIDPDLSMRAHAAKVPVETVHAAVIQHHNGHDGAKERNWVTHFNNDRAVFRGRYDHLGEFRDP